MLRALNYTLLIVCFVRSATAAPIPQWAVGHWVATTALMTVDGQAEDLDFFKRSFTQSFAKLLPETQIVITAHALRSDPGGALTLAAARHAETRVATGSVRALMKSASQPSLFGDQLPYDLDARVSVARLDIRGCAETSVEGQAEMPPVKHSCLSSYTLLQFPDQNHLAIWSANGFELLIYRRLAAP